jgi:methionyl-tRNA synthetase
MDKKFKRTTVTSALPYANGPVHIGHLAGVYVPADIYVRYLRLKKQDVLFVGGSDEHGVPITIRAKKEGITPQDVVDRYHSIIKKSFEDFGISFDIYSRTSSETHHKLASDFFRTLYDKGEFVEKTSEQYYDETAHQFLAALFTLIAVSSFGVAMRTFTGNVTVGQELMCRFVVILFGRFFYKLSFVVQGTEKV